MSTEHVANENFVDYVQTGADNECSCSHNHHDCDTESCKGRVISAETESSCPNVPVVPKVIPAGAFVGKIPVVLAETSISIPILAELKLEERALEIKRIKKNVYVTQCHLLPTHHCDTTGTLFIEGFIRKNVEYATEECTTEGTICGRIKQCTFNVPFRCTTTVTFLASPVLRGPIFTATPPTTETEIFEDTLRGCDVCAEPIIGRDPCQQNFKTTEFFNEPVFCELVSATFNETDIHKNPRTCCENPTEQTFRKFTEKCLLTLTIKVLQKQQVGLTAIR